MHIQEGVSHLRNEILQRIYDVKGSFPHESIPQDVGNLSHSSSIRFRITAGAHPGEFPPWTSRLLAGPQMT